MFGATAGCGDDDTGSDNHADTAHMHASTGTDDTAGLTSTGMAGSSSSGGTDSGQDETGPVDGTAGLETGSTGAPNSCDPVVPGEWNACIDGKGTVDNTLCNWTGLPGTTGFLGCIAAPDAAGSACMITGCADACDCFAPPATGNAEVTCAPVLTNGTNACVLSCADGQTCPDTMECLGGTCYHPAPT